MKAIDYIKNNQLNLNMAVLSRLLTEEGTEFNLDLVYYLKNTPENTNFNLLKNNFGVVTENQEIAKYTITFVSDYGSSNTIPEPIQIVAGDSITVDELWELGNQIQTTNIDLEFTGWSLEENGFNIFSDDSETFTPTSDVTLYAQWAAKIAS